MVAGMAVVKMFSAVAAGIMAYGAVREARRRLAFPAGSIVLSVVAVVALVITYYLLFWFVSLTAGRVLAPWNQWAAYAPPHGTWQRQVNDFFSRDVHQYMVAVAVVGASVAVFAVGALRNGSRLHELGLAFAAINLAFLLGDLVAVILLPSPRSAAGVGYRQVWPDLLITFGLVVVLLWAQVRVASRSFWRR